MSKPILGDPLAEIGRGVYEKIKRGIRDLKIQNVKPVRIELGGGFQSPLSGYFKTYLLWAEYEDAEVFPGVLESREIVDDRPFYPAKIDGVPVEFFFPDDHLRFRVVGCTPEGWHRSIEL